MLHLLTVLATTAMLLAAGICVLCVFVLHLVGRIEDPGCTDAPTKEKR